MRLNQWLALATGLSRRRADAAIIAGEVTVNGQPAQLGQTVTDTDQISFSGSPVGLTPFRYVIFNKPAGCVCSRRRQGNNQTIYDLLPPSLHFLKSVGRLDKESSGLLLLTNDGQLAQQLAHPGFAKTKRYLLVLSRDLQSTDHQAIEAGLELEDGLSRFQLDGQGRQWTATLTQGRNRQIRRTFAALNYKVIKLHRVSFGSLKLADLAEGQFRDIRREDIT